MAFLIGCFVFQIKAQSLKLEKVTIELITSNNHLIDTIAPAIILNKIKKNYFQYTKEGNW